MGVSVREKKKGSGVYFVFVRLDDQRVAKSVGKEAVAEAVAEKIRAQLLLGDMSVFAPNKKIEKEELKTFDHYSKSWMGALKLAKKTPATIERYGGILDKWVLPNLGKKLVMVITRKAIKDVLRKALKAGRSKATLELIRTVIKGPLDEALDDEQIMTNPTFEVLKSMHLTSDKKKVTPFKAEEAARVVMTAKEHRPFYSDFFEFLFGTGVRLGEAIALKWDRVNLEENTMDIVLAFRREFGLPKHGRFRDVDLSDDLVRMLKRRRIRQKENALKRGVSAPEFVFTRATEMDAHLLHPNTRNLVLLEMRRTKPTDTYIHPNSIRKALKSILKIAELPHHRVHDCRHTYASLLISDGFPINYVSEQLGHSNVTITLETYTHWLPTEDINAANRLANIYKSA